jgi:serine/threonine protein kinase
VKDQDDDKTQTHKVLTKGTMVSHYRIVEKIGAGGMGEVYLAEDTELDRKVALKFLPPHLCQDEDCRKRFKREAQAAAKLSHPNIVTIYEVGDFQGRPFFAMEYIEGRSLRDMADEELDSDRIIGIAIQLCDGLQTAHSAGVIHRDIKPSNIVIDSAGRPKLLDFGLGTVGYMSPEQIEGKATDSRSDLFSLGVVLYELIANKSPFRRDDETATLKSNLQDTPEPLARYKSDVPDDLQRIVSKLLEKDPSLRYQSASGVVPDLKKLSATSTTSMAIERIRLVILPFTNLGASEDEYFADGVSLEIASRLSEMSNLSVVSRTTAYTFKDSNITIPQIGRAVGARYVLEGTIRWVKSAERSTVRIIPQLVDVERDEQIWSDRYDREVSDVLALQTDIARRVASALDASLSDSYEPVVAAVNPEAYQYYLMGKRYFYDGRYSEARETYSRAIAADSGFALAYAGLSETISRLDYLSNREILSPAERIMARELAEKALQLEPDLVQGIRAVGTYHYLVMADFAQALKYLKQALELDPQDGGTNSVIGQLKRHSGEYEAALPYFRETLEIDPTHARYAQQLSRTYTFLRYYDKAKTVLRRALSFNPSSNDLWAELAYTELLASGVSGELPHIIEQAYKHITDFYSPGSKLRMPDLYDLILGKYDEVIRRIKDHGFSVYETGIRGRIDTGAYYVDLALVSHFGGDTDASRIHADSARRFIESRLDRSQGAAIPAGARAAWPLTDLAYTYAIMGNKTKTLELVDRVLAMEPLQRDGYQGPWAVYNLSVALVAAQEYDRALDLVDTVLSVPSMVSTASIKVHPFLAPLRDHPRFQALIEKYEKKHGI